MTTRSEMRTARPGVGAATGVVFGLALFAVIVASNHVLDGWSLDTSQSPDPTAGSIGLAVGWLVIGVAAGAVVLARQLHPAAYVIPAVGVVASHLTLAAGAFRLPDWLGWIVYRSAGTDTLVVAGILACGAYVRMRERSHTGRR